MIFNLLLLENLGLSSLTMVKSCKISPFTSYKFFFWQVFKIHHGIGPSVFWLYSGRTIVECWADFFWP